MNNRAPRFPPFVSPVMMAAVAKAGPLARRVHGAGRSLGPSMSGGGAEGLEPGVRFYLGTVLIAAVMAALTISTDPPALRTWPEPIIAVSLAGAMLLASLFPLSLSARTKLYLDTAVLVAAVVLFAAPVAVLAVASGRLAGSLVRREPREQTLFNVALIVLQAVAGGMVLGWLHEGPWVPREELPSTSAVLAALAAGGAMWLLNTVLVAPIVAIERGEPLARSWQRAAFGHRGAETAMEFAQVGIGVVIAALAISHFWWAAPLLVPTGAVYQASMHHLRRRREAEDRLLQQALHDPLTKLPNRTVFLARLEQALGHGSEQGGRVAILFVDLDRFKVVNDSLGHAVGDELLTEIGRRLRSRARPGDVVARLGGDEFTVLLPRLADERAAVALAEDLLLAIDEPIRITPRRGTDPAAEQELRVSASIGIAIAAPGAVTSADLLRDADVALYRAKARGKARWAVFDADKDAGARDRVEVELELRGAVDRGELALVYQPQVDLRTGRVAAMEALVRWRHPKRGLMSPDSFVPLAEESGLILPIGRWVLERACRDARRWHEVGQIGPVAGPGPMDQEPPTVSVNLSARQFQQPALVAEVQRALSVTGLPPRHLRLEITESAMIEDADEAAATLHRLRGLGVRVAIDDFGTGYSNLGYLRRFPVDQLKIDRTFMAEAVRDADATIVRAIIGLAHALGLSVVAEGVETDEQVALLRGLGCEMGQGYLFGEPMAIDQVPARGRGWGPGGKVSGWLPAPARCDLPTQKRTYG